MKRRLVHRVEIRHIGRPVGWLALWASCLTMVACGVVQSVPTLVPTLTSAPMPPVTPSSLPTEAVPPPTPFASGFPTWRTAMLEDYQSFDFRNEMVGTVVQGDIYYVASSPLEGSPCFWANNDEQVGGRDLGSWPLTALTERPLPHDRLSGQCIPVIRGHVYVYGLSGDERLAVFRVVDTGLTSVTFDFILRE